MKKVLVTSTILSQIGANEHNISYYYKINLNVQINLKPNLFVISWWLVYESILSSTDLISLENFNANYCI